MQWPLKSLSSYHQMEQERNELRTALANGFDDARDWAWKAAKQDISAQLRVFLVDFNAEIFSASDNTLRPKLYAFIANALAMFHPKRPGYLENPHRKEMTNA